MATLSIAHAISSPSPSVVGMWGFQVIDRAETTPREWTAIERNILGGRGSCRSVVQHQALKAS